MPRSNEDRLGVKDEGQTPPITLEENNQSPLQFVSPTEFVDLPTKGKFYSQDHPLHNKDTIEIRYMTAKDEDILTSKTLLKKGVAIDRMLSNLLVDKNIKIEDLFIGDKNALIVASRIGAYGADYETKVTCPACGSTSEHSFNLEEIETREVDQEIRISNEGTFVVKLPRTKVEVECGLITGTQEKQLSLAAEKRKKHKLPETTLTALLKTFIVSLNGETDKEVIEKFVNNMPALDSKYLRAVYDKVVPNIDLKQTFQCDSCDADSTIDMPFSVQFFWPN